MNTETHAANVLLNRGVSWPVPAPRIMRIFGKRNIRISVRALKLGTLLELSRIYTSMGITLKELKKDPNKIIRDHLKDVCLVTAICILNSRIRIRLLQRYLARYIMNHFTGNMLFEVMVFIVNFSGAMSFLNTIRLIGDLTITTPKNLSPKDQGSQQK